MLADISLQCVQTSGFQNVQFIAQCTINSPKHLTIGEIELKLRLPIHYFRFSYSISSSLPALNLHACSDVYQPMFYANSFPSVKRTRHFYLLSTKRQIKIFKVNYTAMYPCISNTKNSSKVGTHNAISYN